MGKCDFAMVIEDFSEEYFTHCLLRNLRSLQMYKHADLHPKAVYSVVKVVLAKRPFM